MVQCSLMARSLRTTALVAGLGLASLCLRCDSQTFDLLPENVAGSAGTSSTGGKGNSNSGGINNAGGNAGKGGGGRSGGQNNGGMPFGGFGSLTGGRTGLTTGGFAGKPSERQPPAGCCGLGGCIPCSPGSAEATCPAQWPVCDPTCGGPTGGMCVGCKTSNDCEPPRNLCNGDTRTCTQECDGDNDCDFPSHPYCEDGRCVECRDLNNDQCTDRPRTYCSRREVCVECLGKTDCRTTAGRNECDTNRGVCVTCLVNATDACTPDRPVCDPLRGVCVEAQVGSCVGSECACSDHSQCASSLWGPSCIANRCQWCSPQSCSSGEACDVDTGKCEKT